MQRRYGFALRPWWVLGHLAVLGAAIGMVFLGRWQLDVSDSKHFDLQNFGYAFQWWFFSLCAVVGWAKILRDQKGELIGREQDRLAEMAGKPTRAQIAAAKAAEEAAKPVAYRRYLMPQSSDGPIRADDAVQSQYNAYLAQLDAPKIIEAAPTAAPTATPTEENR